MVAFPGCFGNRFDKGLAGGRPVTVVTTSYSLSVVRLVTRVTTSYFS